MTSLGDRLAEADRELEGLAPESVAARGRAAARRGALSDLARIDAELEGLRGEGGAAHAAKATSGDRPRATEADSPSASSLDVGALFDDIKLSEAPPIGAALAGLVRSIEPRPGETRVPMGREGAIDLAELLEGDSEPSSTEMPIVVDDE